MQNTKPSLHRAQENPGDLNPQKLREVTGEKNLNEPKRGSTQRIGSMIRQALCLNKVRLKWVLDTLDRYKKDGTFVDIGCATPFPLK